MVLSTKKGVQTGPLNEAIHIPLLLVLGYLLYVLSTEADVFAYSIRIIIGDCLPSIIFLHIHVHTYIYKRVFSQRIKKTE